MARTPECNRLKLHQLMYKAKTPPWKDAFRQKCLERLRNSRGRLVDQFRGLSTNDTNTVESVMSEEWQNMCEDEIPLPSSKNPVFLKDTNDNEINEIISFMEEIQKELIEEEKRLIAEHQYMLEMASLESAVDSYEQDEVICPICKKHPLLQNCSIIFCKCGIRIDTERDGLTLVHLKKELDAGLELHANNCTCSPDFCLLTVAKMTNLAITCDVCSFMFLVI